ncbi:MAG: hypothetical protein K2O78_05330 [Muribaculaceae bacterium]|nr:hypothetical protein [Muribaculaceae bacterium]
MDQMRAYDEVCRNKANNNKIWLLLIPLAANAISLFLTTFQDYISLPFWLLVFSGLVYLLVLGGLYHGLTENGSGIFDEIQKRNAERLKFSTSPSLTPDIPLPHDGYLIARKNDNEKCSTFRLHSHIVEIGKDVDFNTLHQYSIQIEGSKRQNRQVYGSMDLRRFKSECLSRFEQSGYEIIAIQNKFGDYLWIKKEASTCSRFDRIYLKGIVWVYRIIYLIAVLMPFLYFPTWILLIAAL